MTPLNTSVPHAAWRAPLQRQQHEAGRPANWRQQQLGSTDYQPMPQHQAEPDIAEDSGNRGDAKHPDGGQQQPGGVRSGSATPPASGTTAVRQYVRDSDAQIDAATGPRRPQMG